MAKIITIGELVDTLKTFDPEDMVNFGVTVRQYLEARTNDDVSYTLYVRQPTQSWHCVELTTENSKVSNLLPVLEKLLPEHKDKCITSIKDGAYKHVTTKVTSVKTHNFEFNGNIKDIPQIKLENVGKTWKKFEKEIAEFREHTSGIISTLSVAQFFLMRHPELGYIYCVSDKFYCTYTDVKSDYPELTDSKDDTGLFEDTFGVRVCGLGQSELERLCQSRKNPKYTTSTGTFTKEELLEKYNITESQIEKLFVPALDGMVCKIPELLSQLQK